MNSVANLKAQRFNVSAPNGIVSLFPAIFSHRIRKSRRQKYPIGHGDSTMSFMAALTIARPQHLKVGGK